MPSSLRRDLRYTIRTLRRGRVFAVAVAGSLALSIGLGLSLLRLVEAGLRRAGPAPPQAGAPLWDAGWSEAARTPAVAQAQSLDALLLLLGAATLLVAIVGCVNVAVLLLARDTARGAEITLRVVLGAGLPRLSRQLLTESAVLCLLGGTLGFVVAGMASAVLHATWPAALGAWTSGSASLIASGLAFGLPVFTAIACGLLPARHAARRALQSTLGAAARATPGRREATGRSWLVATAVAVSVALLVASGMLLRSFGTLVGTGPAEPGFDPRDTLAYHVQFAGAAFADPGERRAAQQRLLAGLADLEGVTAASLATEGAWVGMGVEDMVTADCGNCVRGNMWMPITRGVARHHVVSPGYFEALGIPLLRGRGLTGDDSPTSAPVAVVSRTLMNSIFTGRDPVGRRIQLGGREGEWYTVVGVVGDVRARGLGAGTQPVPALYLSSLQHPPSAAAIAVRTGADPMAHTAGAEAVFADLVPAAGVSAPTTMTDVLDASAAPVRWFAGIFTALGAVAALGAGFGLFGVIGYVVARRTREIGVRLALGARPGRVVAWVVAGSLRLAAAGTFFGLLGGLCIARLLQVMFLGVRPLDGAVYLAAALLLLGVALLASYIPARRAAGIDPLTALRYE